MENEPKVTIIILNCNGFHDTVQCLHSLEKLEYENYKIVLVDNGSSDEEGEKLKKIFREIHLIKNRENRGFAGGNNDGINWALDNKFDYVVNLNNDCIVSTNWLSSLIKELRSTNSDFASSMILFHPQNNIICSDGDAICPDGAAIPENRNKKYDSKSKIRAIFSASGAASIYSAECLRTVKIKSNQFFDELYFAYYEDLDLAIRLKIKSYKGVSIPGAIVYHKHSKTAGEYSNLKVFQSEKNRILNEILNYPFYFIVVGELFFFVKIFLSLISGILTKKCKGNRYISNVGVSRGVWLLIKARFWIFFNIFTILKNRRERKVKGYISRKTLGFFCWDILKVIS